MNKSTTEALPMIFGVIFVVIILVGLVLYMSPSKSNNIIDDEKTINTELEVSETDTSWSADAIDTVDTTFTLSDDQTKALVMFGIDPKSVPSSITLDQQECLITQLGAQRFYEIKDGAVPNGVDFLKAKSCM